MSDQVEPDNFTNRKTVKTATISSNVSNVNNINNGSKAYWKRNVRYLLVLLSIWFIVSFGCGIIFADYLDQFHIGGFPLGFWFGQQGSIYVFVILIWVYIHLMNKLDKEFGFDEGEDD